MLWMLSLVSPMYEANIGEKLPCQCETGHLFPAYVAVISLLVSGHFTSCTNVTPGRDMLPR